MDVPVAGVADKRPESLQETAAEFRLGQDKLFLEASELLAAKRPDLVVVSTTTPNHAASTALAAECGASYVLCEKPMASSIEACDEMIQACRDHGARLAINHPLRYSPVFNRIRDLVHSPEFGGLTSVTIVGGNVGLAMNGSHAFEHFATLTNERVERVQAWFSSESVPNPRGAEFVDAAGSVRAVTRSGRRLYVEIGADQGHGRITVYAGRNGFAVVDHLRGSVSTSLRRPEDRALPTTRYGTRADVQAEQFLRPDNAEAARATLQALVAGKDVPDGRIGRHVVESLVACYLSAENNGREINVADGSLPRERVFPWA